MDSANNHAVLAAMLAPAFFLTATASLLLSANNRLARIIDRARTLLRELADVEDQAERALYERRIALQRQRSLNILRAGQLLYAAISCFVGTSLGCFGRFLQWPSPRFAADLAGLDRRAGDVHRQPAAGPRVGLAVTAINEEMDHRPRKRAAS